MADDDEEPTLTKIEINGAVVYVLSQPLKTDLPDTLSKAEKEVVLRVLAGEDNQTIAHHRGTAVQTVANQLYAIFQKMGVNSRAELIALLAK